jgi:Transposase DDE domain
VPPDLDSLLTALYVLVEDFLPRRCGPGRPPRITDAELVCLAVAQIFLDCPRERRFLRFAKGRLSHLFPYIPGQSGYNKRLRALAPQVARLISHLACVSPSFCDRLRLLDSTPVPCAQSRETVKRSDLAGLGAYGYCASHSRYFWGFRLYLLCAPDGTPIAFELAPANAPERQVAAELLERALQPGQVVLADKGFAGEAFEELIASFGCQLLRPDRRDEPARHDPLGGFRQWIASIIETTKGQLSLERHGARTLNGLIARIAQRLLAPAAGCWHNWTIGDPGRHFTAYDH